ncbi:T9SS type A sorting domain-containing protein [Mariniflexile gromovii]|uniref:T9SS type A sorting domain-containing protein n=1 Tax=Mariniflexile gromovii TaxID=362523 RepID=A0ABS4BW78_9FLAO|nr:T9SS type A sorting domain-containing protein [Mariniflexile gromovii]MBP0904822.1 T9SS type A sorting domain-containing protein [Mariniflexile gromovii]
MKKLYSLLFTILISAVSFGQTVFINEIHYDDAGTDSGEGVEIAGPAGTDLTGYTLTPYNGNGGASYSPVVSLSGIIPNQGGSGYGTLWFDLAGLQNGAPDGIALSNGSTLIQFLSYEGSFVGTGGVADGVTSTDIGVSESGTVEGESLQLVGTGNTYGNFTWSTSMASTYGAINTSQTFGAASPSINITSPSNGATIAAGTTSVNVVFSTNNLVGGETIDITVNGSKTTNVTSPFNITTTNGTTYNVTVELVNGGVVDSDMISFDVAALTVVADLAALRADVVANGTGKYYQISSTPTISYTRASRNQKYIQDATAGILIDDANGTIATPFTVGDGISGLIGQASEFNGVLQLIPSVDATVTTGTTITPEVVSISTLLTSWEDYESELVRINGVTFADAGGTFASSTNYDISDGSTITFRTSFSEVDYIGQTIPSGSNNMNVLVAEFSGTPQLTATSLSELTLSTKNLQIAGFNMYPNPTYLGYVNISSKSSANMEVSVFDVLGKQVLKQTVSDNVLNVSKLNAGLYIMKVSQDDASITKKLVVK